MTSWWSDHEKQIQANQQIPDSCKKVSFCFHNNDVLWERFRFLSALAFVSFFAQDILKEEFREGLNHYFLQCEELARVILRVIGIALGLPRNYFDVRLSEQAHTLRLLHYPPLDKETVQKTANGEQSRHNEFYLSLTTANWSFPFHPFQHGGESIPSRSQGRWTQRLWCNNIALSRWCGRSGGTS